MFEAHFCGLEAQSNVYGLGKVDVAGKPTEILVASLRGKKGPKVIAFKISNTKPISKEIRFAFIPGDAEIISIDTFNKSHYGSNVVVGITFIKISDSKPRYYLNIYSELVPTQTFDLDSIAQDCVNIELNFIPYQLTHAEYVHDGDVETVFLLSGSDQGVHMYRENKQKQLFDEETCLSKCFPEFQDMPASIVTWLEIKYFCDYYRRVTAMGFLDGSIRVAEVNTKTTTVINTWNIQHDSPITSVHIFTLKTDVDCPHFVIEVMDSLEDTMDSCYPDLHLLVTSAIEVSVIYRSILANGFSDPMILSQSDKYDSVLCSCTADVDMDGHHEIILGTYGQEMLVYKFVPDKDNSDGEIEFSARKNSEVTELDENKIPPSKEFSPASPKCPVVHKSNSQGSLKSSSDSTKGSQTNLNSDTKIDSKQSETSLLEIGGRPDHFGENTESSCKVKKSSITTLSIDTIVNQSTVSKENADTISSKDRRSVLRVESLTLKDSREDLSVRNEHGENGHVGSQPNGTLNEGSYELAWQKSFAEPLFAIDSMDLMGDGLEELVILTQKGLHVLQHEPKKAMTLCLERLKSATRHHQDAFKLLQSEDILHHESDDHGD